MQLKNLSSLLFSTQRQHIPPGCPNLCSPGFKSRPLLLVTPPLFPHLPVDSQAVTIRIKAQKAEGRVDSKKKKTVIGEESNTSIQAGFRLLFLFIHFF